MTDATEGSPLDHPIRVLIVEDVPADADLMVHSLRRASIDLAWRVVRDEGAFREALAEFRPDVVLADYRLPRFSGQAALKLAKAHDPALPVILVTGALKEDDVLALMSLGLTSYVLKDRILRLGPEVLHALDRAEARRRAHEAGLALAASERRFRGVAEALGDALAVVDEEGKIVYWNPSAERVFRIASGDVMGTLVDGFVPEVARARAERSGERGWEGRTFTSFTSEGTAFRADGEEFPAELTVSGWQEEGRRFLSVQVRDITVRLHEARTRTILSQAVEQTANSVMITDLEGRIEYVNPAFEAMTGYTSGEVRGKNPRILKSGRQSSSFYDQLWRDLSAGRTVRVELTNRRKDGSEYDQRTTLFPLEGEDGQLFGYAGIGQDVTQEHLLERQFQQAQKMEAVGQLAGGIAHDFNNVLTGVLTNAQLLEAVLPKDASDEREFIGDVISAARRGADLVRRLMAMSRFDCGTVHRVDLREAVEEAGRTVRRILPENIEVSVEHQDEKLLGLIDDGGFHQVLLNLANNARDAMPRGGTLSFRTRREDDVDGVGPCAIIAVADTGVGMDAATVERVFEPFFTTKDVGKGTGLGLAMVYGFVTRAHGHVEVESEPGLGTTVTMVLPLKEAPPEMEGEDGVLLRSEMFQEHRATGTVLIAEDQEEISRVAQKILEGMGYTVITAADGNEALAVLRRERGNVHLVLADLVMPQGGGGMLFRETAEWADQPRFLFMSGYQVHDLNGDGPLMEGVPFLSKPWSVSELESKVIAVMSAAL